jgi:hypothetical protein
MSVSSKKRKEAFLRAYVACRLRICDACAAIKISRSCYTHWMEDDPDFKEMVNSCDISVCDKARSNLVGSIENGDIDVSKYWLEHHDPAFKPHKQEVDLNGGTITINFKETPLNAPSDIKRN